MRAIFYLQNEFCFYIIKGKTHVMCKKSEPEIKKVYDVFDFNLRIPNYQRPYKWTAHNIIALLEDIEDVMQTGKKAYRVGTLILRERSSDGVYEIVDGQQRILTFTLILKALDPKFSAKFENDEKFKASLTYDKISQKNLHDNFQIIQEYINSMHDDQRKNIDFAIRNILEFVVIPVENQAEAFQLFDSQNTRGKKLDPHDLLKAFHLREISDRYSMRYNTEQWENAENIKIRELFNWYLYPIMNWVNREKTKTFTDKDIDCFKGVRSTSEYRYSKRIIKSMPCFQLGEPFESGENFFGMVNHYLRMREDVENEIMSNSVFSSIKNVLEQSEDSSTGFKYAKRLFFCALMAYYDRFGIFDIRAVSKLCLWAFTIRLDMDHLGPDTINNYATGNGTGERYTNNMPMFSLIKNSRSHLDIVNLLIRKNSVGNNREKLRHNLAQLFKR